MDRTPQLGTRLFGPHDHKNLAEGDAKVLSLAARFAAKEATLKALGGHIPGFSWHDIQVAKQDSGAPALVLSGGAHAVAEDKGISRWHVSLSHDGPVAVAFVIAEADGASRE